MAYLQRMKVLIMYANHYELVDEETGEIRGGVSLEYYYFGDHGEMIKPTYDAESKIFGIRRSKCSVPDGQFPNISFIPGVYDAGMEMVIDKDGKTQIKLRELEYVGKALFGIESAETAPDEKAKDSASDDKTKDQPNASDKAASKSAK